MLENCTNFYKNKWLDLIYKLVLEVPDGIYYIFVQRIMRNNAYNTY
jgi:hypothetical protein